MTQSRIEPPPVAVPEAGRWRLLSVALIATFMATFDLYVVNIAVPALRDDLHAGDGAAELIVSGYAFTYAAALVTGGRLGDRLGYRRMFVWGMVAFTVASLLCALATTPAELVAARLAQGVAAAAMVPQVLSLITVHFPAGHRARATAWYGAVAGTGAVAGQILGGLLLRVDVLGLGWRTIFLINVPVGTAAVLLARRVLPAGSRGRRAGFDPIGAAGTSLALALLLAPLALGRQEGWPAWTWACLAAAAPAAAAALCWQRSLARRGGEPIINPDLFRNRPYTLLLTAGALYQIYFGGFLFTLTLLVQSALGADPVQAALVFLPQGVLFTIASMLGGRPAARDRATAGGALVIAGLLLMACQLAAAGGHLPSWRLMPTLALIGVGNGLLLPPLIGAALAQVTPEQAGAASGVLSTTQQFAGSLGVTLLGTAFFALAGTNLASAGTAMATLTLMDAALTATILLLIRATRRQRSTDEE